MQLSRMTVGDAHCEIQGFTHTHIQCAVDRLAFLGGGTVELSAGVFHMADALHLRSGVTVRGQGPDTVLRKNAMKSARLVAYHGFGHQDLIVDRPDVFALGDGISVRDDQAFGFYTTVSTLVGRDGDTWHVSRPHNHDYNGARNGVAETLFPIVSAVEVEDAALEGVALDGNPEENPVMLNGCRGGGFYAWRAKRIAARAVTVRRFNGDGFSFQTCERIELADCAAEECTGSGFHPGSGSTACHIHDCRALRNGDCGLFYCLRVRDSVLEDCLFEANGGHGVSIGARDTGHLNRRLTIRANGRCGIFFRPEEAVNAPHRNTIEQCRIEHNVTRHGAEDAEIVLQGEPEGVQLIGNTILRAAGTPALLIRTDMPAFVLRDNRIEPDGPDAIQDKRQSR